MYWVDIFSQDKNKDELKISVYGISQKSLTEYTNTEKDIIRGINCIPGAYFLMNNTKQTDQDIDDMDLDEFDDFVIIEREDLK